MKRTISLLIALLLMLSFAGCASHEANDTPFPDPDWLNDNTDDDSSEPLPSDGELVNGKRVLSVTQDGQDYSTFYDPRFTAEWSEEGGMTIFTDKAGSIPCMQIIQEAVTGFDAEEYFDGYFTPKAQEDYGDKLLTVGELMPLDVAGRTLQSKMYTYEENGATIDVMRLFDIYDEYVVMYTLYVERGENNDTFTALIDAVSNFQPDADYYANGGAPAPTDNSGGGGTPIQISGEYSVEKYQPLTLETTHYDGGFFSLDLPVGWKIKTAGEYNTFGFTAYDPQAPERQIFFYCKMFPFLKSQEAKKAAIALAKNVSGTADYFQYAMAADYPVMQPTTPGFFMAYNDLMAVAAKYASTGAFADPSLFPYLGDISIIETFANNTPTIRGATLDNSIVRATFISENGAACQGLMAAQAMDFGRINGPGNIDMGYYGAYDFMGVTASEGEFAELEATLQKCLFTFSFTQAYLEETSRVVSEQTSQMLKNAQAMQAAYDSYNAAWSARQTTYDILSQKRSDATLGYERLYDPSTGEIYQADNGFYDDYGRNAGLELIGDSAEQYYLEPIDYVVTR